MCAFPSGDVYTIKNFLYTIRKEDDFLLNLFFEGCGKKWNPLGKFLDKKMRTLRVRFIYMFRRYARSKQIYTQKFGRSRCTDRILYISRFAINYAYMLVNIFVVRCGLMSPLHKQNKRAPTPHPHFVLSIIIIVIKNPIFSLL